MKIYVGNLAPSVTDQELQDLFTPFGEVRSASIIKDRFSGASRGFGFVEMDDKEAADNALAELSGKELGGQRIRVSEAQPRPEGGRGGFGGGSGGGSRGGFGGNSGGGDRGPRRNSW